MLAVLGVLVVILIIVLIGEIMVTTTMVCMYVVSVHVCIYFKCNFLVYML
ncbi:unnamed protein product [Schistosoma mattheei]|uniref:Uncharacterized protein n=1 Tax=Schistosoma mattheei TaxID=31246 RepID=A0A183PX25_9TREM|nr:unnamed protein product [Schistosoma mattheei]